MKKFLVFLFLFAAFSTVTVSAQDKLIILVRHAEKVDDSQDPELSEAGKQRAERLRTTIGKYRPGAFHSTDFKRTRGTLVPLAKKRGKEIEVYDARNPQSLLDAIMKSDIKRHVVSGHSNTIPGFANLVTKKELFKNLVDTEYSVIWLIRIKDGEVSEIRLLDY